mmetsp:Transcript_6899/g.14234  ORF Transcript_6899/g.14234 Transcript_6899/m.14234 type:complete len:91 (-) Transcript_6899:3372-3644(-)
MSEMFAVKFLEQLMEGYLLDAVLVPVVLEKRFGGKFEGKDEKWNLGMFGFTLLKMLKRIQTSLECFGNNRLALSRTLARLFSLQVPVKTV